MILRARTVWPVARPPIDDGAVRILEGQVGELSEGAWADLMALPYSGPAADVASGVLQHRGPAHAVLTGGRWAVSPPA